MNGNTVGLSLKTYETVDEIIDYYFESPHSAHQKTLKEDITSLLSYLK